MNDMSYGFIIARMRESQRIPTIRIRNDIGRSTLSEIENGVKHYLGKHSTAYVGDPIVLLQHPERKFLLTIQRTDDESFFYAFLDSDGNALPDLECYGEVRGKQKAIQEFRERLIAGFIELGYI